MATAITKGYSVGDTVYVAYPFSGDSIGWTAAQRTVKSIDFIAASNVANVSFTDGVSIQDGSTQTVFTTSVACSTAITTKIIANGQAVAAADTATTSGASTAGQVTTGLIRKS